MFTLSSQQPDIVPIICCWCHWYRWQIATGVVDIGGNFAAGVVDIGDNFATGINNNSETGGKIYCRCSWYWWKICCQCHWYQWCTLTCEYLRKFLKKFKTVLMGYSGAGGKLIHEKNQKQKSRDTVPLIKGSLQWGSRRIGKTPYVGYWFWTINFFSYFNLSPLFNVFGTWLGMIRITWGNPQSGLVDDRAWQRATIGCTANLCYRWNSRYEASQSVVERNLLFHTVSNHWFSGRNLKG